MGQFYPESRRRCGYPLTSALGHDKGQWLRPTRGPFIHGPPSDTSKPEGRGSKLRWRRSISQSTKQTLLIRRKADRGTGLDQPVGGMARRPWWRFFSLWKLWFAGHYVHSAQWRACPRQAHRQVRVAKDDSALVLGLSHGRWIDEDGDGRYDTL